MAEVIWTEGALEDIDTISKFITEDSIFYAEKQADLFFQKAETLKKQPLKGHPVRELSKSDFREIAVGKYRLIYKVGLFGDVHIITVQHSSRLLKNNPSFKNL